MINRIKDALLRRRIRALEPWHYDIQLTERVSTGKVFSPDGTLPRAANHGIKLFSPHGVFMKHLKQIYPGGMSGKRFVDFACNAGAHCFTARELDVEYALGFDIRKHWVDQARFVQQVRTVQPTDRIEFLEGDLYDFPERKLEPFDFTVFSGIFYHLPDPVTGLKIAAEATRDVILVNTMGMLDSPNPRGMTIKFEGTKEPMSGVYGLSWAPNSPEVIVEILKWLGFVQMKQTLDYINDAGRHRFEIIASRTPGRLDQLQEAPPRK